MCVINAILKPLTKHKEEKAQQALLAQQKLLAQRNAVADRNAESAETIKDNRANNTKRQMSALRVPLLKIQGTGTNLGNDIGYGLNLGGTE